MKLLDHVSAAALLPRLDCQDKDEVLRRLVAGLSDEGRAVSPAALLGELAERERQGGTAIGGGLAVPHARLPGVERLRVGVATLSRPLALASEDGRPVDVFVMIVGPQGEPRQMLRILARLARMVKRGRLLPDLRAATDAEAMRAALDRAEEDTVEQHDHP